MKQNTSQYTHYIQRGFTIVELLIVVVIIAILAAITIVAYNGIQARANNSAALATANTMARKMNAYYALKGAWPDHTTVTTFTLLKSASGLGAYAESTLPASGVNVDTATNITATPSKGTNTVQVQLCSTGGVIITPYDYQKAGGAGMSASPISLGNTTTCNVTLTSA